MRNERHLFAEEVGLVVYGSIVWYPYPAVLPSAQGQYLAGHATAILLWWLNGVWKTQPGDESDLTGRVRWWAEIPLPPRLSGPFKSA